MAELLSIGRLQVGAALLLTSPFVPMLFQGEEWATRTPFPYFADHGDPELIEAVRRGRLAEFAALGWQADDVPDPEDDATFARARLAWSERDAEPHRSMLAWYRTLIALRRQVADLRDDDFDRVSVDVDDKAGSLIMRRGEHVVIANLGIEVLDVAVALREVLAASSPSWRITDDGQHLIVPPDAVVIARRT